MDRRGRAASRASDSPYAMEAMDAGSASNASNGSTPRSRSRSARSTPQAAPRSSTGLTMAQMEKALEDMKKLKERAESELRRTTSMWSSKQDELATQTARMTMFSRIITTVWKEKQRLVKLSSTSIQSSALPAVSPEVVRGWPSPSPSPYNGKPGKFEYDLDVVMNYVGIGTEDNQTDYVITLYRIERTKLTPAQSFNAVGVALTDPRHGWKSERINKMVVATSQFKINSDTNYMTGITLLTYVQPQLGAFKALEKDKSFEGKGFTSLLGHISMMIAAELGLVMEIESETGTTQNWLENHYSQYKVAELPDFRKTNTTPSLLKPDGQINFKRAGGDYFASVAAYQMIPRKKTLTDAEKKTFNHQLSLWKRHIKSKLDTWFTMSDETRALKFKARAVGAPLIKFDSYKLDSY